MAAAPPEPPTRVASLAELRDVAIAREPDRYFAATLAPAELRYDLVVLAAFAAEVSRIPALVSEPLAGEIRLQWWRDALIGSGGDEAAAGHPVAMAMRAAMARFALPGEIVESVIDAQADALHGERPADEKALLARMAAGEGGLFRLAARICAGTAADDDPQTAERAGLAYGLARELVQARFDGVAWLLIPRSLVADENLVQGNNSDASEDAQVAPALAALAHMVRAAHADVAADFRHMSRRRRLAFLPLAMVRPYLRALEKDMNQPGSGASEALSLGRLVRIAWAHASGRV